jgi:2-polyprenyl-3-methyl-5-hydroxy-6-metoxy-1,4-benzoquinol methylase
MIPKKRCGGKLRTACPICDLPSEESTLESPNHHLCPSCLVVYRKKVSWLAAQEGWDEIYYSDDSVMNYYLKRYSGFRKMVDIMTCRVRERGKWLDVGCGVGVLLQVAHEQGWKVYGVEPSHICVEEARKRMKYARIVHGTIEERSMEFTGLTVVSFTDMLRFVEHPGLILRLAFTMLGYGGWVFIREINGNFRRKDRAKENAGVAVASTEAWQQWTPRALEKALLWTGFRNVHSIPSPVFVETTEYEHGSSAGLMRGLKKMMNLEMWPMSRTIHIVSRGRVYLGPNFITLGRK